jgi:uncharacterized protein (TIGR03000 family)
MAPAGEAYGDLGAMPDPSQAHLRIFVPADAKVWVEDVVTTQTGSTRYFTSPQLSGDKEYVYHMKAQWQKDGRSVSREQQVTIHAGDWVTVDFNQLPQGGAPPRPQPSTGS